MKSVIPNDSADRCYICGSYQMIQEHHIFGGPDRNAAEKHGLKVHLCLFCHNRVHGMHGKELMQELHEIGQREFEKTHTREQFRKEFRKSYL